MLFGKVTVYDNWPDANVGERTPALKTRSSRVLTEVDAAARAMVTW
jgi:hypothetical protein